MSAATALRRTVSVARKEFLHMLRDPGTLFFSLAIPVLELFMLGYAIDTNVRHIRTVVYDACQTQESRAYLKAFENSDDFDVTEMVYRDDDRAIVSFRIERGWTRIGRSSTADLQLDDPSVSRRHALIVAEPGKELRVLDDRSLNGVFVNGKPIEWEALRDGDELAIGRYKLYALRV